MAQWENDLQNVSGVVTSSPWPERIEIVDIDKLSDYRYRIEADIIEITSVEMVNGGEAARRSISLEVEKTGTRWFIVRYQNNENPVYKNSEYGFSFALPDTWRDYSIISSQWEGMDPESSHRSQRTHYIHQASTMDRKKPASGYSHYGIYPKPMEKDTAKRIKCGSGAYPPQRTGAK